MHLNKWPCWIYLLVLVEEILSAEYNVLHTDGSYEFSYDNPNSYHRADANRYNIVRGEFGSRNPGTGGIDSTVYTAGPRGFRPRGKNVARKYDLSQVRRGPIGSRDDPYYDPNEDPSYNFAFKTRTYQREEAANRLGDVSGRYSYIDDVGERHNVDYIAGKNTGFHVKTPFPDSNPRSYGPLFFNGRGKPLPRGRTSIQRGLDGSYRFVSAGPDQRRTETSDSTGHVRGSYTYLDDKGVQHAVHYIAGPGIGYRVLKNVKGPHLPTLYPFGSPSIIPSDFYDFVDKNKEDVFDTAASGHVKPPPIDNTLGGSKPGTEPPQFGADGGDQDYDTTGFGENKPEDNDFGSANGPAPGNRPGAGNRPFGGGGIGGGGGINKPSYEDDEDADVGDVFGDFGGGGGVSSTTSRPGLDTSFKPPQGDSNFDDSSFKPSEGATGIDNGSYKPSGDDGVYKPDSGESGINRPQIGSGGVGSGFHNTGDGGSKEQSGSFDQGGGTNRPSFVTKPQTPSSNDYDSNEVNDDFGLFDSDSNVKPPSSNRPGAQSSRPSSGGSSNRPGSAGINRPNFGNAHRPGGGFGGYPGAGITRPVGSVTVIRPGFEGSGSSNKPSDGGYYDNFSGGGTYGDSNSISGGGFGTSSFGQDGSLGVGIISGPSGGNGLYDYKGGTVITNLGDTHFSIPPGLSVRAHVQAIDLLPLGSRVPSPSEQFKAETSLHTEQLNEAPSNISNSTVTLDDVTVTTETNPTNSTSTD